MTTKDIGILSIFKSVDGEVNVWGQGNFTVFIRTRGCTVGCFWCDSKYSWANKGGIDVAPAEVVRIVQHLGGKIRKVTITGGEPLEQDWPAMILLIHLLADHGYNISIETAGTQNTIVFRRAIAMAYPHLRFNTGQLTFIVDYKLSDSKFNGEMNISHHFSKLGRGDIVKFVIFSEDDFMEACNVAYELDSFQTFKAHMYFSPVHGQTDPEMIYQMMIDQGLDQIGVGINMQMHKFIWTEDSRTEEDAGFDFTKRSLGRAEYLRRMHEPSEDEESA